MPRAKKTVASKSPERAPAVAATFYMGNHAEVVARAASGFLPEVESDAPFIIGSHAFLGQLDEAEFLYDKTRAGMSKDDLAASRFFLAVAFCRHSQYQKARGFLASNLRAAGRDAAPLPRLFVNQGVGFYRFFCGRFRDALRHARSALLAAMEANHPYGKFLATDLSGHALVQSGHIAEGLGQLHRALGLARALGNGGMAEATQIGIACYEAQFGLSGPNAPADLKILYTKLEPQNTYSRATLLLELSRQLTLRGDVTASHHYLDEACRIVYALQHRRQSATFNHRHAYNLFLAGDYLPALNLIRLAKSEIHPDVDLVLDLQLSGLQLAIVKQLGFTADAARLDAHVTKLTARTGSYLAGRMAARRTDHIHSAYPVGQDALGDLLDQAGKSFYGQKALLDAGYHTPFRLNLGLPGRQKAVLAAPTFATFLVIDPPSALSTGGMPSRQLRALLCELAKGERTKEDLVREIWGYKYHPGRHDPLVHQAMARLRDALGTSGPWLEFTGAGYRLNPLVKIMLAVGADAAAVPNAHPMPEFRPDDGPRGPLILEYLLSHRFIDAKTCAELFSVSRVTASRDLAQLHQKRAIRRHGSGRTTRYELGK